MKNIRFIAIILLLFIGLNALAGGYLLIQDPSGSLLGITVGQLNSGILDDFLIPGILLFVFNGLGSMLTAFFLFFQWRNYAELVILQGMVLFAWITAQIFFFEQVHLPQYLLAGAGIFLFVAGIRLEQILAKHH